jgi:hypothetical protein
LYAFLISPISSSLRHFSQKSINSLLYETGISTPVTTKAARLTLSWASSAWCTTSQPLTCPHTGILLYFFHSKQVNKLIRRYKKKRLRSTTNLRSLLYSLSSQETISTFTRWRFTATSVIIVTQLRRRTEAVKVR